MKNKLRVPFAALAAAALLTGLAASGLLNNLDWAAADAWYQTRSAPEEDIVLVGIDQRAVEEIGPYQEWGRDIIAMAIEALNESADCRPAAIAVDVLYVGETDEGTDAWLAEAASAYGNVITASAAQFADTFYEGEDGLFRRQRFGIQTLEEPFPALREATVQGHINAMLDADGVLRHHLLYLDLPGGERVPSMALAAAEMYRAYHGLDPIDPPPTDGHGFWYLPFTGEPGDFDAGISVADLIAGEIPADYFAGKIVLIGPYTVGLQDDYITSADRTRPMYGMEYQANAIQALLLGEHKLEMGDGIQLALLLAVLVGSCLLFLRLSVKRSTLLWLVLCGGWLGLTRLLYAQGLVLRVLWLPLGVTSLYVGCIGVNYIHSALEKRRVTSTFKRYVAPEIIKSITARYWIVQCFN